MTTIIFESHGTTADNETGLCSGWNDVDLSAKGLANAADMGQRYTDKLPDAVFCSDLQRSYKTAAIAFKNTGVPLLIDERLRECDYGQLTGAPKTELEPQKAARIDEPFPDGESYRQATARVKAFLDDVKHGAKGKTILIIGHRATQYALEKYLLSKKLEDVVVAPWAWQAGWTYNLL